jgi:glycosyltransferase involved in cell wall biosynthesis
MNRLRIAYLISQYPAISHTFILREVRTLRALGLEITVASINAPDRPPAQLTAAEREESSNTFYIKPAGLTGALTAHLHTLFTRPLGYLRGLWFALRLGKVDLQQILYGFFYFIEAVMLGRWMQQQQLTHVHVHIPMAAANVALIAKHTFPITFSITVHGPNEFYNTPGNYLPPKILDATFLCCISHFARSQLMMLTPPANWTKLELSRLGVDPTTFTPRPVDSQPNPIEILCVGRLVPVKGQSILITAVARLLAQGRTLRLRLVGDGPDRHNLEQQIQQSGFDEQIILAGAVNQDKILDFYHQADIFVLASFAEGIPVVLMEAMIMEIPCISTHITGIPELIGSGEGLLVAPADVEALTEAIALLMDNPELRRTLGQAGRQKILQHYELQKNTKQLAEIFQRYLLVSG